MVVNFQKNVTNQVFGGEGQSILTTSLVLMKATEVGESIMSAKENMPQ